MKKEKIIIICILCIFLISASYRLDLTTLLSYEEECVERELDEMCKFKRYYGIITVNYSLTIITTCHQDLDNETINPCIKYRLVRKVV